MATENDDRIGSNNVLLEFFMLSLTASQSPEVKVAMSSSFHIRTNSGISIPYQASGEASGSEQISPLPPRNE